MNENKIYLTENEIHYIISQTVFNILNEEKLIEERLLFESSLKNIRNFNDLIKAVKKLARRGLLTISLLSAIYAYYNLNETEKETIQNIVDKESVTVEENNFLRPWKLECDNVTATVYNAVPSQCNADCGRTATMFRLNMKNVYSHRIIAIERTMMDKYDIQMGDVVYLEGVGEYDGIWQVQDKMNKRFAGQNKIDLLVPNDVKHGLWKNVRLYVLKDKTRSDEFKSQLSPQLSKAAFNAQFAKK